MDLYNFISRKSKFFTILADVLFIAGVVILFIFYKDVFKNQNVLFYTYSTIVQGFLALIGFLGALAIFKIQLIENEAQKVSSGLEHSVEMYKGREVHSYSWGEMVNACSHILSNKESQWQITEIQSGYDKLCKLRDEKSPVRNNMVDFSIITMVNIMISLFGILLSNVFISNELYLTNAFYSLLALCLSFISIKGAFSLIRSVLGYSFTLYVGVKD
jgi:hypothetical protein